MKISNDYQDFSEFENRLLKRVAGCLAKRLGLTRQDREDFEQELALCLWRKKEEYDPDHVSGSGYETYITNCIENKALDIQKEYFRDPRNSECSPAGEASETVGLPGNGSMNSVEKRAILRADLSSAIENLSPDQKQLVGLLASGKSIAEIARESGLTYVTMYSRVRRLRDLFRKYGFDISAN